LWADKKPVITITSASGIGTGWASRPPYQTAKHCHGFALWTGRLSLGGAHYVEQRSGMRCEKRAVLRSLGLIRTGDQGSGRILAQNLDRVSVLQRPVRWAGHGGIDTPQDQVQVSVFKLAATNGAPGQGGILPIYLAQRAPGLVE